MKNEGTVVLLVLIYQSRTTEVVDYFNTGTIPSVIQARTERDDDLEISKEDDEVYTSFALDSFDEVKSIIGGDYRGHQGISVVAMLSDWMSEWSENGCEA